MVTARARTKTHENYTSIVTVIIPELGEVRRFAAKLHVEGKPWKGEAFGWQAEDNPERPESPLDSKMTFTPADFCIRESGIWFFSPMWEHGKDAGPIEFLDDRNNLSGAVTEEVIEIAEQHIVMRVWVASYGLTNPIEWFLWALFHDIFRAY